jgi:hypothetical protein
MLSNKLIAIEFKGVLMRRLIGVFGVLVMIMICGCSDSGSKLIGAWSEYSQYEYGKEHCEFFKDGSCYFEDSNQRVAGRWSVLEDGRIKVEVTTSWLFGGAFVMTLFAVVTADELVLDGGGDNRGTYARDGSQRATEIQSAIKKAVKEREIRIEADKRAQAEKREAEDEAGNLKIITFDIADKFIDNSKIGKLFIILGKVKNEYSGARSFIKITGKLYAKERVLSKTATVCCGNVLSDQDLSNMDMNSINKRLSNLLGDNKSNVNVKPGKLLPFMIVFSNIPDNIEEYTVEVAGSSPAGQLRGHP